jgi:hypothetical protein
MFEDMRIAKPCTADWEKMKGNDRVRRCGKCDLRVYNFAELTRAEAEDLVRTTEGRLCVRLYRRFDGTILTRDCRGRRPIATGWKVAAAALALLTPILAAVVNRDFRRSLARLYPQPIAEWIHPSPPPPSIDYVMGEMVPLMPTPPSPPLPTDSQDD